MPTRATMPRIPISSNASTAALQLSFASIDDNQLRQRLPFSHHTRITTVKGLFHGSEIVCADNSLYIEMAVIATSRFSTIREDHTTRDRICATDIGLSKHSIWRGSVSRRKSLFICAINFSTPSRDSVSQPASRHRAYIAWHSLYRHPALSFYHLVTAPQISLLELHIRHKRHYHLLEFLSKRLAYLGNSHGKNLLRVISVF